MKSPLRFCVLLLLAGLLPMTSFAFSEQKLTFRAPEEGPFTQYVTAVLEEAYENSVLNSSTSNFPAYEVSSWLLKVPSPGSWEEQRYLKTSAGTCAGCLFHYSLSILSR